jgi:ATP-binding cassette, subfamily A (ABC1), member 3
VSRRKLWNIIARVASERQICSVILTTHSMEECEALCSRLGIMVDGALQCLGSIQHLKAKFGTGFSAEFKLGDPKPELVASVIARLSAAMQGRTTVDLLSIPQLCAAVGLPQRAAEISDSGSGWALFASLQRAGAAGISLQSLADWWADEDQAAGLTMYMTHQAFPGAKLVER